jgi:hypothetical protein
MNRIACHVENQTPTPPASSVPAFCAPSDVLASFPDGAPPVPAPQFLDCSVETEPLSGPVPIPTIKQKHVDSERRCPSGKLCFLSYRAARQILQTFKNRRDNWREKGTHLVVYACDRCQRFHLGNASNFIPGAWKRSERTRRPRSLPTTAEHVVGKHKRKRRRKDRRKKPPRTL